MKMPEILAFERSFQSCSSTIVEEKELTEFPGMHFREKPILFIKMPKFPTFERIFQSGNTVSFRLMKGEKGQELHMS